MNILEGYRIDWRDIEDVFYSDDISDSQGEVINRITDKWMSGENLDEVICSTDDIAVRVFMRFLVNIVQKQIKAQEPQRVRNSGEYNEWRAKVYHRDNYTCQNCGKVGGSINAHHIKPFAKFPELRLDVNNGITLCKECHKLAHRKETRQ